MTTDSDQRPDDPGALITEPEREETWRPCAGLSKYEVSDLGNVRNTATGKPLAARTGTHGYLEVKPYDDNVPPKRQTRTVHGLVLAAFAGPRPDGQETLHGPGGPHDNRWPENLRWGTKPENHADQRAAGTAVQPRTQPCVNHATCGGMVVNAGSRCVPCVTVVGQRAAAMYGAGINLERAAARLGYPRTSADHVFKMATKFAGYTGPVAQVRAQGRRFPARQLAAIRYRIKGDGT